VDVLLVKLAAEEEYFIGGTVDIVELIGVIVPLVAWEDGPEEFIITELGGIYALSDPLIVVDTIGGIGIMLLFATPPNFS
jgi:hypothetical protein